MYDGKEERRRRTRKNKIEIFSFDFFHCEEKQWNSAAIFYTKAKIFKIRIKYK